jgi:hypothetical protein
MAGTNLARDGPFTMRSSKPSSWSDASAAAQALKLLTRFEKTHSLSTIAGGNVIVLTVQGRENLWAIKDREIPWF